MFYGRCNKQVIFSVPITLGMLKRIESANDRIYSNNYTLEVR